MRPLSVLGALAAGLAFSSATFADDAAPSAQEPVPAAKSRSPFARGRYTHLFSTLGYGRGLRWNNPFRLQKQLGDSDDSLSLSAGYWDLAVGATFGEPRGLQHGAVLHLSIAAQGISQQTLSASYVAQIPLGLRAAAYGRAGVPLVLSPDAGIGAELAAGAVYFVSGGIGINAELVQSLFVGAATWEHDPSLTPVTSLQLGLWFDYEVLP